MAKTTLNGTKAGKKRDPSELKPARITDKVVRRLRAIGMVQQRMHAKSRQEIAAHYGVTAVTVDNELKWAKKNGVLEALEERLLGEMGQKALNVVDAHMDEGSLEAAKAVVAYVAQAQQHKARREEKATERDYDLEDYLAEKRAASIPAEFSAVPAGAPAEGAPGALLPVLDGGVAESPAAQPEGPDRAGPVEDPGLPDDAAAD